MSLLLALAAGAAPLPQPDRLATLAMHNFGACVAGYTPQGAREILAMDYATDEYDRKVRSVAEGHGRCAPGSTLRFNHVLFAGALAEALVESDFKPHQLPKQLNYDPARESIAARSPTEEMALCTVLNAPEATAELLRTEPASSQEVRAMEPLGPVLGECLKEDMKIELNKAALRSILALAAYRIVSTPKSAMQ